MPGESLEDKIKAIMSGNMSPALTVSKPPLPRVPTPVAASVQPIIQSSPIASKAVVNTTPLTPLHRDERLDEDEDDKVKSVAASYNSEEDSPLIDNSNAQEDVNAQLTSMTSEVDDEREPSVQLVRGKSIEKLPLPNHAASKSSSQPSSQQLQPHQPTAPTNANNATSNDHTVDELLFGSTMHLGGSSFSSTSDRVVNEKDVSTLCVEDTAAAAVPVVTSAIAVAEHRTGDVLGRADGNFTVQLAEKDDVDTLELMRVHSIDLKEPTVGVLDIPSQSPEIMQTAATPVHPQQPSHHYPVVSAPNEAHASSSSSSSSVPMEATAAVQTGEGSIDIDAPKPAPAGKGTRVRFDVSPPRSAMKELSSTISVGVTNSAPRGPVRFSIAPPLKSSTPASEDPMLTTTSNEPPITPADPPRVDQRKESSSSVINISPPRSAPRSASKKASKLPVFTETSGTAQAEATPTSRARATTPNSSSSRSTKDLRSQPSSSNRTVTPSKKDASSRAAAPTKSDTAIKGGDVSSHSSSSSSSSSSRIAEHPNAASSDSDPPAACHAVTVAVRVRPLTPSESRKGQRRTLCKAGDTLVVVDPQSFDVDPDAVAAASSAVDNNQWTQSFEFDHCLWDYSMKTKLEQYADQVALHQAIGLDIVDKALSGISCSCFAYGHTSTGKTYSLFGGDVSPLPSGRSDAKEGGSSSGSITGVITSESGLIQRVFHDIIRLCSSAHRIFVTFLEIYNEKIRDLLTDAPMRAAPPKESLKLREHPSFGPYVEHLTHAEVFSADDACRLVARGYGARSSAHTLWNTNSSRSHAIVSLEIVPSNDPGIEQVERKNRGSREAIVQSLIASSAPTSAGVSRITRVQMIDLAGSEKEPSLGGSSSSGGAEEESALLLRQGHGGSSSGSNAEKERNESKLIRRSLSSLGYIIKALTKGASLSALPYRDSALTFLLRDALSGHNHTAMLATISPAQCCYEETLATLRYAERLRQVNGGRERVVPDIRQQSWDAVARQFERVHVPGGEQLVSSSLPFPPREVTRPDSEMSSRRSSTAAVAVARDDAAMIDQLDVQTADLDRLKNAYRAAASQIVELQIDLDALKADRDSLMVQLKGAKNKLDSAEDGRSALAHQNKGLTQSLRTAEKESGEAKLLLKRKEENVQRLLGELSEEKQARVIAEQAYHARTKEFLARFETLKNENKALSGNLDGLKDKYHPLNDEKREYVTQIERLRAQVKTLLQGKDALTNQLEAAKGESAAKDHKLELLKSKARRADELDKQLKAATAQMEKMKSDVTMAGAEKASLAALIAQKESLLKIQGRQSDMSMKLLRQRQERADSKDGSALPDNADSVDPNPVSRIAGVDDFDSLNHSLLKQLEIYKTDIVVLTAERDALASVVNKQLASRQQVPPPTGPAMAMGDNEADSPPGAAKQYEQYAEKLQRNLHDLFSREGELMYKELVDTQKLTAIIRDLRRQLSDSELLVSAADLDKDVMSTVQKQLADTKNELHAERMTRQALELKLMTAQQELQTAAQSPPQLLEAMRIQHLQLQAESSSLRDQVVRYQSEIGNAQSEALRVKEAMQLEYNALWQSVQDLNRLDEQKDRSIKDILRDRDQAVADKTRAFETLAAISMENSQLKQELEEIDQFLLNALRAGSYNMSPVSKTKSIVIQDISDSVMNGLARRNNNDTIAPSSSSSSRVKGGGEISNGGYGTHDANPIRLQQSVSPKSPVGQQFGVYGFQPYPQSSNGFTPYNSHGPERIVHADPPTATHTFSSQSFDSIPYKQQGIKSSTGPSPKFTTTAPPKLPYENTYNISHSPALDNPRWNSSDRAAVIGRVVSQSGSSGRETGLGPREEVSEEVLERQIEELSGYLGDEVKSKEASKGFVNARNSLGAHSSSASGGPSAAAVLGGRSSNSRPTTPTGRGSRIA